MRRILVPWALFTCYLIIAVTAEGENRTADGNERYRESVREAEARR